MQEWNRKLEIGVADRTADLHRSEARFRQLAEATHEGIAVSEEGILVDGNPQLCALYGYEMAEMIGRPLLDFIAPESREKVRARIREENESTYECTGLRKDGTLFPMEIQGSTRISQGRQTRITAMRDLTIAKEAAARILSQQSELNHSQRIGLLSEVSTGIIHQLSQPLCGMAANLAAVLINLEARGENCDTLKIIRDIDADVARLRDMVLHLRALANPVQPPRACFDFNAMVEGVLGLLRNEAEIRGIGISDDLGDSLPPLYGDSVQLAQVVLNLGCNALDACDG